MTAIYDSDNIYLCSILMLIQDNPASFISKNKELIGLMASLESLKCLTLGNYPDSRLAEASLQDKMSLHIT